MKTLDSDIGTSTKKKECDYIIVSFHFNQISYTYFALIFFQRKQSSVKITIKTNAN